ncbi:MAG: MFS transporter [Rhodospirillales bacterium]|nr:MFS transporter [Rhodospirillales bacterium]
MLARLRPILPVLLGIALAQLALGALNPLISLLLVRRGEPTAAIGLVLSCYFVGFLLGTQFAGRIVDRVGHIRSFAVFAAVAADAALLHALVDHPVAWAAFRAISGFALAGVFLVAESWLNHKSDGGTRGRTFAAYLVVSWGASAVGPLAINLIRSDGEYVFAMIAMGFATALIPMALTVIGNPEIAQRSRFGVRRLMEVSPLGVVAGFGAGLVNSAYYAMLPVYIERVGLSPALLSVLLTTSLGGGLLAQYPIGWIADRHGRRPVALATMLLAFTFALAILAVGAESFATLLVLAFLFSGMMAPLYGLAAGQISDYVAPKDFVAASSGLLFAWALGASAGPTASAAVMSFLGPSGLFVYAALVLAAIAAFTIWRMRRRGGVPLELQSGFVPAAQTPPALAEIDPRSER